MHLSYQALLTAIALQASTVLSHPVADRPAPAPPPRYVVTSQQIKDGQAFNAGLSVLAGESKRLAYILNILQLNTDGW